MSGQTIDRATYRRFYAEEIEAVARLSSPALVNALATVPREQFLPPGPWTVLAESDVLAGLPAGGGMRTRTTADADPRRVYHNVAIAIDASRLLFNGQPSTLCSWIDAIDLRPGMRLLHVGCGLGYYTAVMAHCVGPTGRVVAFDVDEALAAAARRNLLDLPWIEVRHGDASQLGRSAFDAIVVNAGVPHPLDAWLEGLVAGGRMILPMTATMPAMGSTIGKGLVFLLAKQNTGDFAVQVIALVAIYSAIGVRDEALNTRLGKALMAGPTHWQHISRLRRDAHDHGPSCWLHAERFCLSLG